MGGRGSGRRWRWGTKDLTTQQRALDVRRLHREGILARHWERIGWRWSDGGWIELCPKPDLLLLVYRYRGHNTGGEWRDVEEEVRLDWTVPHYGGRRPWFLCPACSRRAAKLYGGARFLCRRCARLAYPSQNENVLDRRLRRANKIRLRLGGEPGMLTDFPWKPKGMHWRTYARLRQEVQEAEGDATERMLNWLHRAGRRTSRLS